MTMHEIGWPIKYNFPAIFFQIWKLILPLHPVKSDICNYPASKASNGAVEERNLIKSLRKIKNKVSNSKQLFDVEH